MKLLVAFILAGLIYVIQRMVYRGIWNKNLDADLSFEKDILYEGEDNTLCEVIENRKYFPVPILQVKFSITRTFLFKKQDNTSVTDKYYRNDFFTIMPWQKITRAYPFTCSKRGFFNTDSIDLICRSFFMDEWMLETKYRMANVCVLPRRISHKEIDESVNNLIGEIEKNLRINEDPFTFAGIRDYQPFDNMRSINWKITARHGDLLVNTYNSTFSQKVVLLLNVESNSMLHNDEIAEWAIRIAAHLASHYISMHIPTAFYTNCADVSMEQNYTVKRGARKSEDTSPAEMGCPAIDAGADMSHIRAIEIALARLNTGITPASFLLLMDERIRKSREKVEYVIISNYRKKDVTGRYEALLSEGYSIHFIVPELNDTDSETELDAARYTRWIRDIKM